jgi:hypothetical protein
VRRRRTGDEAVAVADEAGPDDAGVDAVGRDVGTHLPEPVGERSGVQDVGELGQRVRPRRIIRSVALVRSVSQRLRADDLIYS